MYLPLRTLYTRTHSMRTLSMRTLATTTLAATALAGAVASATAQTAAAQTAAAQTAAAQTAAAQPATAQPAPVTSSHYEVRRVCAVPDRPGFASCEALKLVPGVPESSSPAIAPAIAPAVTVKPPPRRFLTPADLHAAYALPDETPASRTQTVAVVDAFDDPTAEADLAVYDEQFGLPPCTSANGCFRKIDQEGDTAPLPRENGGWAAEIAIDVEMAHAICQGCHVLLVETDNESFAALTAGVQAAIGAGASEISNSYGAAERRSYLSFAGDYDHPGVVVTASSGDCGYRNEACPGETPGAEFPAGSPDVIAVGGTTLRDRAGTWRSTAWREGGSACSELFEAPSWQSSAAGFPATGCGTERAIADVSAIGNPNTGVDVYDTTPEAPGEPTGWAVFGGTSVSSPIVAAEFGLAGGAGGVAYPAATLYEHLGHGEDLYDVVAGRNGSCRRATICRALAGFDGPTGVGSPLGLGAFAP